MYFHLCIFVFVLNLNNYVISFFNILQHIFVQQTFSYLFNFTITKKLAQTKKSLNHI